MYTNISSASFKLPAFSSIAPALRRQVMLCSESFSGLTELKFTGTT